jgi:predicted ferric reductase
VQAAVRSAYDVGSVDGEPYARSLPLGAGEQNEPDWIDAPHLADGPVPSRVRSTPRWWREAVQVLTVASVLVVVGLWALGGSVQQMGTPGGALQGAGRLTGLVSADLLLIQVLLMARIPLVERAFGQDELTRRHRTVGFWSFNLLLAHIVMITVGQAMLGGTGPVAYFLDLVAQGPGVLLATAATVLLTLVVVGSVRLARRKLRYESWHLIHLYAYLGVGLSVPHELSLGNEFTTSRLASTYWWGLYGAALGAVLIWRVGQPLWRSLRHRIVVDEVVIEGAGVVSVHLRGQRLDRLGAAAGQFFTWRFLDGPGWSRGNPFSLSAAPTSNGMRITVKGLGDASGRLAHLRPGTRVLLEGPYGRLHAGVRTCPRVTLIAAGIGITPIRALLEDLDAAPGDLTLLYRARSPDELVLVDEIDRIAADRGARVYYLLGPRRMVRRGISWLPQGCGGGSDVSVLKTLVPGIEDHDVYLCGPDEWQNAVRATLLRAGVAPEHLHTERFAW